MADETLNYLVALDPEAGFCRLFRTDSPESAGMTQLWSGLGLRAGYDAMIRLNRERRPTEIYRVASREGSRGGPAYRLFRGEPPRGWAVAFESPDVGSARTALSALVAERDGALLAERRRLERGLKRAGVRVGTVLPRLTPADRRYLAWLEDTGRTAA